MDTKYSSWLSSETLDMAQHATVDGRAGAVRNVSYVAAATSAEMLSLLGAMQIPSSANAGRVTTAINAIAISNANRIILTLLTH
jgi:hypothetical protein